RYFEHGLHDAAIDTLERLRGFHLLADEKARPWLGFIADKEGRHGLRDPGEKHLRFGLPDRLAVPVGGFETTAHRIAKPGHMGGNEGADIIRSGDIEPLLATEIIGDRLQVYTRRVREHSRRRAVETVAAENVDRGSKEPFAWVGTP